MINEAVARRITLAGVLPKPDPRSLYVYLFLAALMPATYLSFYLTGIRMADPSLRNLQLLFCIPIFIAWMLRRAGHNRIATAIETTTLPFIKGLFVLEIQYAALTLPIPYADDWLLKADRLLGFDWLAFARIFSNRAAFDVLAFAYVSMNWQAPLVLVLLCATDRLTRAWQIVTATMIALAATTLIFPFFPADGRYVLCGLNATPTTLGFCDFVAVMHSIKDGGVRVIEMSMLNGMVAFPSFHTAAAILLIWGAWPLKRLRWPALALNLVSIVSTIVVGGHYLIDLIGGLGVAIVSIWLAIRLVKTNNRPRQLG